MPTKQEAKPKTSKPAKAPTPGQDIQQLFALRGKKRDLEAAIKDLEGQISLIEERVMENMEQSGLDKMTSDAGTVSISTSVVANVIDWDAFGAYIVKNKFLHLLQRRVSDPAYRELLDAGKKIPGVQPFPKKRLNVRAAS